jgi:hypothetical protein
MVPFGIDNKAFERSAAKGRSRAARLNDLLRSLFVLQVKFTFILQPYWLSSADNFLADALSRGKIDEFLAELEGSGFLAPGAVPFQRPGAGRVVTLADNPYHDAAANLRELITRESLRGETTLREASRSDGSSRVPALSGTNGMPRRRRATMHLRGAGGSGKSPARRAGFDTQTSSVHAERTSIFHGLPAEQVERLEEILDNRLSASSKSKVATAMKHWQAHCDSHGWDPLMTSDLPVRGARLASWVLSMLDDTDLVYKSISTYVWGVCTWHTLQHELDPTLGVQDWREFMGSIAVLAAVPSEPRKPIPVAVIQAILESCDTDNLADAQFGLMILILFFTFTRTEVPCPKNFTGPNSFDPQQHWQFKDFKFRPGPNGTSWVLWVLFKAIKQDRRMERPSATHAPDFVDFDATAERESKDWVPIGDVPGSIFSIAHWFMKFTRLMGRAREPEESMFFARDGRRPYTYRALMDDLRERLVAVGADASLGPHGLRVEGYNCSKQGNGVELTVAHGGWMSGAHSRYERFQHAQVLSIPARMVGLDSVFDDGSGQRAVGRSRVQRGAPAETEGPEAADGIDEGAPESEDIVELPVASRRDPPGGLPPGVYHSRRVSASGRAYDVYVMPQGPQAYSCAEAWRRYRAYGGASEAGAADGPDLREWRDDDEEPLPAPVGPTPAAGPEGSSEPHGDESAATPSRRQGTRSARVRMPPGGRRGDEDLSSIVVYSDRPSSRRDPVRRHA